MAMIIAVPEVYWSTDLWSSKPVREIDEATVGAPT